MILYFGLSGAVIFLGLGPLLLLLWLAGVRLSTLTWKSFGLVVAMGLIDNVCSDYLYAQEILLAGKFACIKLVAGVIMDTQRAVGPTCSKLCCAGWASCGHLGATSGSRPGINQQQPAPQGTCNMEQCSLHE
jgi:hypothetical protein